MISCFLPFLVLANIKLPLPVLHVSSHHHNQGGERLCPLVCLVLQVKGRNNVTMVGCNNQHSGGGHGDKYGEVYCGCLCFSNPNLTLFALLFLGNAQEKERRRPQRGIRMASDTRCGCEAEEKVCPRACFFNSEL